MRRAERSEHCGESGRDPTTYLAMVRFYTGTNTLISSVPVGHPVTWRGRRYDNQFGFAGMRTSHPPFRRVNASLRHQSFPITVRSFGPREQRQCRRRVLALWTPCVAGGRARCTRHGSRRASRIRHERRRGFGRHPTDYRGGPRPTEIKGRTESRLTRGFGYPVSEGELAYLRLPEIDVVAALGQQMSRNRAPESGKWAIRRPVRLRFGRN